MQRVTKELAKETQISRTKQGFEHSIIAKLCIFIHYGLYLRKFCGLIPRLSFLNKTSLLPPSRTWRSAQFKSVPTMQVSS